ncbi:hypothetical protein BDP27DRAFT_1326169 [Rhodocollybia butyracea]|uniref:Arrestin-like N-terminal domain-containing protein n=1 Tax=Rhodocollybia butyracea TaxID=206335 RepID=A0A9P5PN38_9AGAR|nr:hypothetical protein BDP27DRAFT_1326169 [Rhodocollybia butyracea]
MPSSFDAFIYGNNLSSLPQSVTSLPAYTPPDARRELTEHLVELSSNISDKHAKPWATLRVYSKAPGEKITGSVTLDSSMRNSRHILCVKVMVRGELFTVSCPRIETNEQHWPFSIDLPREVITSSGGESNIHAYKLPPTFMERKTRACVRYNLIVHITRTKFREDSNLQTAFTYIPAKKTRSSSPLRQLAYQENSPLLGPEADPDGWYTLPSMKVYGTLFSNRVVEVTCSLSYTRGSVIPLSLILTSEDSQVVDLLSSGQALAVKLRRRISSNPALHFAELNAPWTNVYAPISTAFSEDVCTASWWKRLNSLQDSAATTKSFSREIEGEIVLSKTLKPTFQISHFGLEYSVVMLPFNTSSFVPRTDNGPILEQRVEIATIYPKGPRPIAHSPPEYVRSSSSRGRQ